MPTRFALVAAAVVSFASATGAQAPAVPADTLLARRLERLERQVDSLRQVERRQDAALAPRTAQRADTSGEPSARPGVAAGGIYTRPFVHHLAGRVTLGGWADFEYRQELSSNQSVLDQHHLVPFLYARVTDELRVAAEVELVHAPRLDADGNATSAGGLVVDYATLDYHIVDPFSLRGGVILSPIGRYNLLHDSPLHDLTARPLVVDQVIPGTLGETGVGAFGRVDMRPALLTYEAYVVNGFTSALLPGAGDTRLNVSPDMIGTRGAADASTKNVVGRLAISPFRGLEIGGSAHWGPYGDGVATNTEKHDAMLWAVDGAFDRGMFVVRGELASLRADLPAAIAVPGVSNGRQGWYAEGGLRFGSGWLPPYRTSRFTVIGRWDEVDLGTGVTGDVLRRASAGLAWRPVPIAAIKGSFEWNWIVPAGGTTMQAAPNRLLFSAATYF